MRKFGNKNYAAKQSGNRGPKQQTNFKAKFKPPGKKHQSGGGSFNKGKSSGDFNSSGRGQGFNKNKAMNQSGDFGQQKNFKPNFKSPGKFQSGRGFNKNKTDFKSPSPGGGQGFNKNEAGGQKLDFKLAGKNPSGGKSFNKNMKGARAQKEKLKFDDDSSDEEIGDKELEDFSDEEMIGSDDVDEMESEEEEESDDEMTSPAKSSKQMETMKRKLAEMKQTKMKVETKTPPPVKVETKTTPTVKVEEQVKDISAKNMKGPEMPKEKLKFDEDSSDEEDEEVGDEEMDFSDEEMMGSDDEDEMESEEEEESDNAITSPAKSNKEQNAETLKRKLAEIKTPPTPQSAVKKARLEGGEERSVKVEEQVKEKPAKKEAKKEKKMEQEAQSQNIPKLSDVQVKAILAEEGRRREERDKRTLFTRCETFKLMKDSDIKALHPDIVSIRHNHGMSWLIFPSEDSAVKAYSALSKKTELNGKDFFVDRSGANSKNSSNAKGKFDNKGQRPINPLELVLVHLPKPTTEEQLRVIFPAATQIDVPNREKQPGKKKFGFGGRNIAFIKFGNVADAKKAYESHGNQAMLKIGGEMVDMYYRRV